MKQLKNYRLLGALLLISLVALFGIHTGRSVTEAAGSAPVFVTNTGAAQAIPTAAQGTTAVSGTVSISGTPTVNVGNTATSPALVRDVDNAARHAFTAAAFFDLSGTSTANASPPFTVPTGKRLVIEHVSLAAQSPSGAGQLFFSKLAITGNGTGVTDSYNFPLPLAGTFGASDRFVASHLTRIYADPESAVSIGAVRSTSTGGTLPCNGSSLATLWIAGMGAVARCRSAGLLATRTFLLDARR